MSYHPWTRVCCCDCQLFFFSHNFVCKQSKAVNSQYLMAFLFKIENQSLRKHFSGLYVRVQYFKNSTVLSP